MKTITLDQVKSIQPNADKNGVPVRFMDKGKSYDIITGAYTEKCNIIYAIYYYTFSRETALKLAKLTETKAVFEENKP